MSIILFPLFDVNISIFPYLDIYHVCCCVFAGVHGGTWLMQVLKMATEETNSDHS